VETNFWREVLRSGRPDCRRKLGWTDDSWWPGSYNLCW